jgi:hypothetical protein
MTFKRVLIVEDLPDLRTPAAGMIGRARPVRRERVAR